MGVIDKIGGQLSGALGSALGFAGNIATDAIEKASREIMRGRDGYPGDLPEGLPAPPKEEPKSLLYDPFAIVDQMGYKDSPSGISYRTLAEMARRVPVFTGIVQTRTNQMANFALPRPDDREPGFRISLRDSEKPPTKAEKKRARAIERWVENTGSTQSLAKDTFETFLRKLVRDSLIYDQACFEVVANDKEEPADFFAVDAATVRIADIPPGVELEDEPDRARYVQIYDEVTIAEFAIQELCFGVRNPRTDIRVNGYGFSELEMLISTITAMLWAFEYNKKFFTQGSAAKGVLNFRGSIPDAKLDAFRRHWYAMISGANNAWRTPITNADELQWISLQTSNRDMEYSAFFDFLIKVTCGVCQFDPAELNFSYGNTGQSSQMFQAPAEQRIKGSKDRGLRPLLRSFATWLNRYVIWPIEPDMQLEFTGINPKDASEVVDLEKKQVSYKMTVDELRAEDDLPPMPDGKGEVILDPTWLQFVQGKEAAQQQEEQGQEEQGQEEQEEEGGEGDTGEWDWQNDEEGGQGEEKANKSMRVRETLGAKTRTYEIEL